MVLAAEDQAVVAEEENTSIWYIRLEGCLIIQTAFFAISPPAEGVDLRRRSTYLAIIVGRDSTFSLMRILLTINALLKKITSKMLSFFSNSLFISNMGWAKNCKQ